MKKFLNKKILIILLIVFLIFLFFLVRYILSQNKIIDTMTTFNISTLRWDVRKNDKFLNDYSNYETDEMKDFDFYSNTYNYHIVVPSEVELIQMNDTSLEYGNGGSFFINYDEFILEDYETYLEGLYKVDQKNGQKIHLKDFKFSNDLIVIVYGTEMGGFDSYASLDEKMIILYREKDNYYKAITYRVINHVFSDEFILDVLNQLRVIMSKNNYPCQKDSNWKCEYPLYSTDMRVKLEMASNLQVSNRYNSNVLFESNTDDNVGEFNEVGIYNDVSFALEYSKYDDLESKIILPEDAEKETIQVNEKEFIKYTYTDKVGKKVYYDAVYLYPVNEQLMIKIVVRDDVNHLDDLAKKFFDFEIET